MIDEEIRMMIAKAICKARKAYTASFEEDGIECSHYQMDVKVRCLDGDYKDILHTIEDKDSS